MTEYERLDQCYVCGEPEEDHHVFTPDTRPLGCSCDPRDFKPGRVPPVCGSFILNRTFGDCLTCQHPEECHAA